MEFFEIDRVLLIEATEKYARKLLKEYWGGELYNEMVKLGEK